MPQCGECEVRIQLHVSVKICRAITWWDINAKVKCDGVVHTILKVQEKNDRQSNQSINERTNPPYHQPAHPSTNQPAKRKQPTHYPTHQPNQPAQPINQHKPTHLLNKLGVTLSDCHAKLPTGKPHAVL
jgi:hypothetical protein